MKFRSFKDNCGIKTLDKFENRKILAWIINLFKSQSQLAQTRFLPHSGYFCMVTAETQCPRVAQQWGGMLKTEYLKLIDIFSLILPFIMFIAHLVLELEKTKRNKETALKRPKMLGKCRKKAKNLAWKIWNWLSK